MTKCFLLSDKQWSANNIRSFLHLYLIVRQLFKWIFRDKRFWRNASKKFSKPQIVTFALLVQTVCEFDRIQFYIISDVTLKFQSDLKKLFWKFLICFYFFRTTESIKSNYFEIKMVEFVNGCDMSFFSVNAMSQKFFVNKQEINLKKSSENICLWSESNYQS